MEIQTGRGIVFEPSPPKPPAIAVQCAPAHTRTLSSKWLRACAPRHSLAGLLHSAKTVRPTIPNFAETSSTVKPSHVLYKAMPMNSCTSAVRGCLIIFAV